VNDDTGENLVAIVEDTFNEGSGVVRRDGMARPMSGSAMADLKRLVETRCKWPDDDLQQSSSPAQGRR
jgi:hypothetical protein